MSRIRAVLFDMDGVLIDAKEWHYEALNQALELFGLGISRYDHVHTFDGLPTRVKLEMISKRFFLPAELHPLINSLKQKFTMQLIHERCKPMFHHEYALSKLHGAGFRIAVCSNSMRATIEMMMEKADLLRFLDLIIGNEEVQKTKPDPEIYLTAIRHFGLKPDECLVVEDNPNGIAAGRASGAFVLPVSSVYDVNYDNISAAIARCEGGQPC